MGTDILFKFKSTHFPLIFVIPSVFLSKAKVAVLPNNIKDQLCESIEKNWNKDFCLVDDIDHRFVTERIQRTTTERDIEKFFEQLQFLDKVKPEELKIITICEPFSARVRSYDLINQSFSLN